MTQSNESEVPAAQATGAVTPAPAAFDATRTRLNPRWVRNMTIYIILLLGLGVWGLIDALVVYPKRGARAAEFYEYQYLKELKNSPSSFTNDRATVSDPAGTLDRLKKTRGDGGALTPADENLLVWLTQLHLVGKNTPANTAFPRTDFRQNEQGEPLEILSAGDRLASLEGAWTTAEGKPKGASPLDWYDIPSQWLFVAVGLGLAPYLFFTVMRAKAKVYRFEHGAHALTLPTGDTILPFDVSEFDKTKWDKVFITLHIREGHPTLGGRAVELDLLRFVPLEAWVLKMEEVKAARDGASSAVQPGSPHSS